MVPMKSLTKKTTMKTSPPPPTPWPDDPAPPTKRKGRRPTAPAASSGWPTSCTARPDPPGPCWTMPSRCWTGDAAPCGATAPNRRGGWPTSFGGRDRALWLVHGAGIICASFTRWWDRARAATTKVTTVPVGKGGGGGSISSSCSGCFCPCRSFFERTKADRRAVCKHLLASRLGPYLKVGYEEYEVSDVQFAHLILQHSFLPGG